MTKLYRFCELWYYGNCKASGKCGTLEKCNQAKQRQATGKIIPLNLGNWFLPEHTETK